MKKAITIIFGVIIIVAIFAGCGGTSTEETTTQVTTTEATTASEEAVKAEVDEFYAERSKLSKEATELINKVKEKDKMDPDLFDDITYSNRDYKRFMDMSRKQLSPAAYEEVYYDLEDYDYSPIIYSNRSYYIPSNYFITAEWSDNVAIPDNNDDYSQQRVYTLIDDSKPGYLLIGQSELPPMVILIRPGDALIDFE